MSYKHFILIFHLLVFSTTQSHGSPDPKLNKYEIFDSADFVFIGQILEVNTKSYEIKVLEKFKGEPFGLLEGQIDSYSIRPESGDLWLFYAQDLKENKITTSVTFGSKNFNWPYGRNDISFPEPPPVTIGIGSPQMHLHYQMTKNMSWNELYYEIMTLRQRKMNDEINNSHKEIKELIIDVSIIKTTNNMLLVLVFILVIVSAIVLFRKL